MSAGADALPAAPEAPGPATAPPELLRRRAEFLRAASALRQGTDAFLLQGRPRADGSDAIRVGFTCSRKVGNAVMRNRARRRLREIARAVLPGIARPGWDYVLVGRPGATVVHDFAAMKVDLARALRTLHRKAGGG